MPTDTNPPFQQLLEKLHEAVRDEVPSFDLEEEFEELLASANTADQGAAAYYFWGVVAIHELQWKQAEELLMKGLEYNSRIYIRGKLEFALAQLKLWCDEDLTQARSYANSAYESLSGFVGTPVLDSAAGLVNLIEWLMSNHLSSTDRLLAVLAGTAFFPGTDQA